MKRNWLVGTLTLGAVALLSVGLLRVRRSNSLPSIFLALSPQALRTSVLGAKLWVSTRTPVESNMGFC